MTHALREDLYPSTTLRNASLSAFVHVHVRAQSSSATRGQIHPLSRHRLLDAAPRVMANLE